MTITPHNNQQSTLMINNTFAQTIQIKPFISLLFFFHFIFHFFFKIFFTFSSFCISFSHLISIEIYSSLNILFHPSRPQIKYLNFIQTKQKLILTPPRQAWAKNQLSPKMYTLTILYFSNYLFNIKLGELSKYYHPRDNVSAYSEFCSENSNNKL